LHQAFPQWLRENQRFNELSSLERRWLFNRGSLTSALMSASQGEFGLQLLSQSMQRPRFDEAQALGSNPRHHALVREIVMFGHGQPWVFARSVIPLPTLSGQFRHFKNLDDRPLGALLFNDPSMQRSPIETALLQPQQLHHQVDKPAWARRSVFHLRAKPLLVCEVFLPSFDPMYPQ